MASRDDSPDTDIDAINSALSEGLDTCRSMVVDYRAALSKVTEIGSEPASTHSAGEVRVHEAT